MTKEIDPVVKRVVLRLLKRGAVTIPEAASWAFVSRHAVYIWMKEAGFTKNMHRGARSGYAAQAFERELASQRKRPTKLHMRAEADEAKATWDWKGQAPPEEGQARS